MVPTNSDGDVLRADYFKVVTPFIASAAPTPLYCFKEGAPENQSSSSENVQMQCMPKYILQRLNEPMGVNGVILNSKVGLTEHLGHLVCMGVP